MLVSDKLAILGNLAGYPFRINTKHATEKKLSFSACVIAMALFNGDLTPLFAFPITSERPSSSNADRCVPPSASWLPFNTFSLNTLLSHPPLHSRFRTQIKNGSKCLVLNQKVIMKGLLWDIEPYHELDGLREDIRMQQRSSVANNKETEYVQFFFQLLVRRVLTLKRRDILELIIAAVMRRQLTSPNEILLLVYELEEWFHGQRFWPAHIAEESFLKRTTTHRSTVTRGEETRGVKQALTYTDAKGVQIALAQLDSPMSEGNEKSSRFVGEFPPIIRWIHDAISNGLPLALGKCNIGEETLISIFTCDPAKYQKVFAPLSELEYEFGKNPWINLWPKDSFWYVRIYKDKVSDEDMQTARKELGGTGDNVDEHGLYMSDQILEVEYPASEKEVQAIWSPRLSRLGMVTQDSDGKSWKRVPLGQGMKSKSRRRSFTLTLYIAASYFWFR